MIINNNTLRLTPWQKPAISADATQKDFQPNLAALPNPTQSVSAKTETANTDRGSNGNQKFDEAFAKMMVNLKMATASSSGDSPASVATTITANQTSTRAANDSAVSNSSLALATNQDALKTDKSATEQFMDYMKQSDTDKMRQQMTGVSKEEYEKMSPEEQAALDKKIEEMTKEQTRIAQETVKAKIAMAKAELA